MALTRYVRNSLSRDRKSIPAIVIEIIDFHRVKLDIRFRVEVFGLVEKLLSSRPRSRFALRNSLRARRGEKKRGFVKAGENLFISGSLARPGGSRSEIPSFLRALRSQLLHTTSSPVSLNLLRPRYEDTCWCRRVFAASDSSGACRQHLLDATFHPLPLSLFPFLLLPAIPLSS